MIEKIKHTLKRHSNKPEIDPESLYNIERLKDKYKTIAEEVLYRTAEEIRQQTINTPLVPISLGPSNSSVIWAHPNLFPDDEEEVYKFQVAPRWLIDRIKETIQEFPEFVEGILKLDGPTSVFVCADHRESISYRELTYVHGPDCCEYIFMNDKLYTYEDLEDMDVINR
jgi:hypothetical protein